MGLTVKYHEYFILICNEKLLQLNPDLASSLGTYTGTMQSYIENHGGYHSTPMAGDLAMWNRHVEFVVDYDGTFITLSGSRGSDGSLVPRNEGENWLTKNRMNDIAPGFIGFWTVE